MTQVGRHSILTLAVAGAVIGVLARPPLPQDPAYHRMADQRSLLGIPNCLNVLSNIPFAVVGLVGLGTTFRDPVGRPIMFLDAWERWPYAVLFTGTALTALGSACYPKMGGQTEPFA